MIICLISLYIDIRVLYSLVIIQMHVVIGKHLNDYIITLYI